MVAGSGGKEDLVTGTDIISAGSYAVDAGGQDSSPVFDAGMSDGNTGNSGTDSTGVAGEHSNTGYDASGPCDVSEPPASVAAWIDETWAGEGRININSRRTWLFDSAVLGNGQINICVRYGATRPITPAMRDQIGPSMQMWMNKWFSALGNYDCFPYSSITVKVTGWAVKPGQESVLQWSDSTIPIYTEVSDGSDQAPGEPKCPDACGFFFHPNHQFATCPGGEENHFDYTLWMNDDMSGGAAAVGGDWGVRIPASSVLDALNLEDHGTVLHEMGHGFGFPDYYSWTGSRPEGGSVMIVGSSFGGLTNGDQWMIKRFWKETKALRYP